MMKRAVSALLAGAVFAMLSATLPAEEVTAGSITVASTTSTENSGLFEWLLPRFTEDTGIAVRVIAVGTGQAIRLARNGDSDLVIAHHRPSEEALVADGIGIERIAVMYNDFVLVGPSADPANIAGTDDLAEALQRIVATNQIFASRGDDSGTHKKEQALWRDAGTDPVAENDGWYRETGSGMGATLNVASGLDAYTLSDRATWMQFGNKGNLRILIQGDSRLHNPYGVVAIDPSRFPHVNAEGARLFIEWLVSAKGQQLIAGFRIEGQQVFFPDVSQ